MTFTHRKKVYYATCVQWLGSNLPAITELLHQVGYSDVSVWQNAIMARGTGLPLLCVHAGWWVRVGEDRSLKVMDSETFVAKYQPLEVE